MKSVEQSLFPLRGKQALFCSRECSDCLHDYVAGGSSRRQSLHLMMLPGGYSKSHSLTSVKLSLRQIAFEAGLFTDGKAWIDFRGSLYSQSYQNACSLSSSIFPNKRKPEATSTTNGDSRVVPGQLCSFIDGKRLCLVLKQNARVH